MNLGCGVGCMVFVVTVTQSHVFQLCVMFSRARRRNEDQYEAPFVYASRGSTTTYNACMRNRTSFWCSGLRAVVFVVAGVHSFQVLKNKLFLGRIRGTRGCPPYLGCRLRSDERADGVAALMVGHERGSPIETPGSCGLVSRVASQSSMVALS